ncbi:MAG: ABC transporter substrate-binding protein [Nanoarchaeota archaeon]
MNRHFLSLVLVFLLIACTSTQNAQPIKIGVLGDLTGDYVSFMRGVPRGAELAVEDAKNLVNRPIQLVIEDQRSCQLKETVTIMNKLTSIDHVDFVLGGSCSSSTLAAAPIAESTHTPIISPVSSAPSVSKSGDYIFRTYISDGSRALAASELTYKLGKRKMATLVDISNDAFIEIVKGAKFRFQELGGVVVAEEESDNVAGDFRTQLTKIKVADPDVLFLTTGPQQIGHVAKEAKELGLHVQFIVPLETAEDQQVIDMAGSAVEGLLYVMPGNPPDSPKYQELQRRYKERYKEEAMPSYVTEAYDAVMLGILALKESDGSRESIKDKLYEVSKTYEGVSGNVAFDANGDVSKPVMYKQIKNGKFVVYTP